MVSFVNLMIKMRVLGLEPRTYGLKEISCKITDLEHNIYKPSKNHLTTNLTENSNNIQQELTRIIDRFYQQNVMKGPQNVLKQEQGKRDLKLDSRYDVNQK